MLGSAVVRMMLVSSPRGFEMTSALRSEMCIRDRTMGDRIVVMKDGLIQQVDTPQNLSLIHI